MDKNNLIENIRISHISKKNFKETINQLREIAVIHINDFQIISKQYLNCVIHVINSNIDINENKNILELFYQLIIDDLFIKNNYNLEFGNFIFNLFDQLIHNAQNKETYELLISKLFLCIYDKKDKGLEIYKNLIDCSNYIEKFLKNIPKIKDENIMNIYFSKILILMQVNYYPSIDVNFIIDQLDIYLNNPKSSMNIINIIIIQFNQILEQNNRLIDFLFNKCKLFEKINEIIMNPNPKYTEEIKLRVLDFLELILLKNDDKYEFTIPYNIELGNDSLSFKLNSIIILYEEDSEIYYEKISKLIDIIENRINDKNVVNAIEYFNLLFSIIKKKKYYYLNLFNYTNKINNLLYQLCCLVVENINNKNDNKSEKLLNDFLKTIFNFIFEFNKKLINYKLKKSIPKKEHQKFFQSPKIFEKKTMKSLLKIFFDSSPLIRKQTIHFLLNISVENKFIISPYIFTQMIKIFFKDKNYTELQKLITLLNELFEFEDLNIKIMLQFNIVPIFMKLLLEIPQNEKFGNVIKKVFENLCKYLTRYHIEKYMLQIYSECRYIKNALIHKKYFSNEFFLLLIELLKKSLKKSSQETLNCINISKNCYSNPLIYNMVYMNSIFFPYMENKVLSIYLNLKISSYNNIHNFSFCNIQNGNNILNFYIDNKQNLIVVEKNNNITNTIFIKEKFNENLKPDKIYHQILILINKEKNDISLFIDKILIFTKKYKLFQFLTESINFYIGYNGNDIENINDHSRISSKNILNNTKIELKTPIDNNSSFISISYLLITNNDLSNENFNDIMKEYNIINGKNKKIINLNEKKVNLYLTSENIIVEVLFNNQNIKLSHSNKFNNLNSELKKLQFINYDEIINKYIPYIECYNPKGYNNKLNKIFLITKCDNIKEFISFNQIYQVEKIHKVLIKNKLFIDYGIDLFICNTFFIDFFIGLIYEYDGLNLEDMSFFSENILDLLKIILSIDNEKILNYFLYENDIMKVKLKIFFQRNKNILNDENFIDNLIRVFDNNIKCNKIVFILYETILIDELVFNEIEDKNTVITLLKNNLFKISNEIIDVKIQKTLYKIYLHLYNIINYFELSLIENNDGFTLLDLIIECEKLIIKILFNSSEKNIYIPKITNNLLELINITNRISLELNGHQIDLFIKNYSSIIDKKTNFLNSKNINSQMKKALKEILDEFSHNFTENNKTIKNNIQVTQNKRCLFCEYVSYYITLNFCNIENNLKFLKYKNKYYSNAFLNFHIYKKELNPEKFAWYLSDKEGISRIRNKFVFKENDFHSFEKESGKNKNITKMYKYEYSKEKFEEYYEKLNQILIYDKICKDYHFYYSLIFPETFKKDTIINNCLYLKRIQKTNSLFILTNEFIYLYTNLIIDQNGIIHVNNGILSNEFWTKTQEDSILELNNFINKNCDIHKPDELKEKTDFRISYPIKSKFGFDCNYKLIIKKISLRKITELYKRSHLHIENSIEILLKNGSSYFLVFNIDKRDEIFNQIMSHLNNYYQKYKKQPSIINFSLTEIKNPNLFYLKYSPKNFSQIQSNQSSIKKKPSLPPEKPTYKIILDSIKTSNDQSLRENWINIKITNFDYIMLLNTLSGRTYNDFSQYLIFPWILQNFNNGSSLVENIFGEYYLNIIRDQLYRNLYYPIFAQSKEIRENLKTKYDLRDEDSKYHSGTFYSTHAFVSYFLIRQRPFTEIHLEIQGGQFDTGDRLFIGENQLSILDEKYQELIPALFTIPELYFNTNHFDLGTRQNKKIVDNFELPNWCKKDPRLFCLIIKKMLEGKKINENIHHWFDLIFGFRQEGIKASEVFNTYRSACYKMNDNQFKEMTLNNTLNSILFEKEELGCMPNLLFNKEHPKRIKTEWINKSNVFFDSFEKVSKCKIQIVKNFKFNLEKNKKIGDIVLLDYNVLLFNNNFKQGGICSLYSFVNSFHNKNEDCDNFFESEKKFAAITKGNIFCGKKKNKYLTFYEKYLILVHPSKNLIYNYFIGENVNITSITCNDKGNKIYVGFENGNIKEYKLTKDLNSVNNDTLLLLTDTNGLSEYEQKNYLIISNSKIKDIQKEKIKPSNIQFKKINKKPYIFYTKNSLNYPHNPIKLLKLNEAFNVLISIDTSNTIYIISINNNFQLLHIVKYLTNTKQSIKDIIIIPSNGDFLVYTSLTVYLFSINGIPLSVLYLTDKVFDSLSPITYCTAVSLYDVVLFLSHKEKYITIWKVVNRYQNEDFFDRTSYTFNQKTSKYFLNDYNYGYNINDKAEKKGESELIRKFDIVTRIDYDDEEFVKKKHNVYFNFMKMSHDMSYLILIDNINNFYVLNYTKDKKEINNNTLKKILADGSYCVICKRDLAERISRISIINSTFQREEDRNICDDCRKHLTRCDNLLYGY